MDRPTDTIWFGGWNSDQDPDAAHSRRSNLSTDLVMNNTRERSTLFIDDNGNVDSERYEGEWGWASWKGNAYFRAEWDRFRATWEVRYIHEVAIDDRERNPFDDINGASYTCLGPPSDVQ